MYANFSQNTCEVHVIAEAGKLTGEGWRGGSVPPSGISFRI